jgi:hypothetical protein
VEGAEVVVAQRVEDELDLFAGRRDGADVLPTPVRDLLLVRPDDRRRAEALTDLTAAQRTSRDPCLVIRPRWTWVSDSWCLEVSPAQHANCAALPNREASPISATNTAARTGPTPGNCWTAT